MKKSDFKKLYREAFSVDARWANWFFESVYSDDEAMFIESEGKAVSMLLSSPFGFAFHGQLLRSAYISCVATAVAERGRGHMRTLMTQALRRAHSDGAVFATLIPASRHLYFAYDRLGFATVFYCNELRYTSLHEFRPEWVYVESQPSWSMFTELEGRRPCGIRHSEVQYQQAVRDVEISGGFVAAVKSEDAAGMAFVSVGSEARVLDLLADSDDAAEGMLAEVRRRVGHIPIIVNGVPSEVASDETRRGAALRSRGMLRIVDVEAALGAVSAADPSLNQTIRVSDPLIPENNDVFVLRNGKCERASARPPRLSLDVTVHVLARLLFSAPSIGSIFNLPTSRPFISLMLD